MNTEAICRFNSLTDRIKKELDYLSKELNKNYQSLKNNRKHEPYFPLALKERKILTVLMAVYSLQSNLEENLRTIRKDSE